MKIIDWNISYNGNFEDKFNYLKEVIESHKSIVILQEVTEDAYLLLKEKFSEFKIEYSLNYRIPSKFDTKSRKLGIVIMVSKEIDVINTKVIDRCLLPERTLLCEIECDKKRYKVLGLHSITGCDHKKAKSLQFYSFAETIEEYRPDIVGIDANEPDKDNISIDKMVFFDNKDKGKGAKTFFETLNNNNLIDSLLNESIDYVDNQEEPLKVSHIINKKIKKRYDFVFLDKGKFDKYKTNYNYESSIEAGSDHSLIEININNF